MGIINILPSEISNKIAAGEVVERPASVVKELVENSIDAGATVITIEIKKGGTQYIRVSDNGCGMSAQDAAICFLRHATSKIHDENDLDAIYTLGFRGEALSSIGAVSEVSLYTKREDSDGICVTCKGGEILSSEEAGIPNGTTVVAENLFFNTPARAKFLKKDQTEAGYITDIVTRCIFAHPEISFRLIINGKDTLHSPGDNSLESCVYTVYGKDYAKGILEVCYEEGAVKISGVIGKGTLSRPNRNYQSFFVNKRYIKSAMLTKALEEAYKNQIMIGKHPMSVLNIEINPELIDINVHPTKLEVKFSDDRQIYQCLYYAVKNTLYEIPNVPQIERTKEEPQFLGIPIKDLKKPQSAFERDKSTAKTPTFDQVIKERDKSAPKPPVFNEATKRPDAPAVKTPDFDEVIKPKVQGVTPQLPEFMTATNLFFSDVADISEPQPQKTEEKPAEEEYIEPYFKIIGQLFNSYIIAQNDSEMLLIDQHAAHERLKYEELLEEMQNTSIMSQILIEPETVRLSPVEMAAYIQNRDTINALGFDSEEFGDDTVIVRSVPGDLEPGEVEGLMIELVTQCASLKNELISQRNERLTYTIACKAAVKANTAMSQGEMETLVRRVLRLKNINTCPHGRPIIITMTKKEIEKEFKRIV
ncbi:MAG: DNA mismatch repair endonuclease MutL [Clostridiales bacterium]|nr:DNA mismatch repair endonuclease MutL [Clostridiales bacterium]